MTMDVSAMLTPKADEAAIPAASRLKVQSILARSVALQLYRQASYTLTAPDLHQPDTKHLQVSS
jgi:hypothetical protein